MKRHKKLFITLTSIIVFFIVVACGYSIFFFNVFNDSNEETTSTIVDDIKENYDSINTESINENKSVDITIYVFPSTVYYDVFKNGYVNYTGEYTYTKDGKTYDCTDTTNYKCLPEDKFGYIEPKLDDDGNVETNSDGTPIFNKPIYYKASESSLTNKTKQTYPSQYAKLSYGDGGYTDPTLGRQSGTSVQYAEKEGKKLYLNEDTTDPTIYAKDYIESHDLDARAYPKYIQSSNSASFAKGSEIGPTEVNWWSYNKNWLGQFSSDYNDKWSCNAFGADWRYDNYLKQMYIEPYTDTSSGISLDTWLNKGSIKRNYYDDTEDLWADMIFSYPQWNHDSYYEGYNYGAYYIGDPEIDKTVTNKCKNESQVSFRNVHSVDRFGYWSNLKLDQGRYLPIKLTTNNNMSTSWFYSIVKNLNCDMSGPNSGTTNEDGDDSNSGMKNGWADYTFSGFTYVNKNSDGSYNFPYETCEDMYASYANDQLFNPFNDLLQYATLEDNDGDGKVDDYVIRLYPVFSDGKNVTDTQDDLNGDTTTPLSDELREKYKSNEIGLYDAFRLKITYKDSDTTPTYNQTKYYYYTFSKEVINTTDETFSKFNGTSYCSIQGFHLTQNMEKVEFQIEPNEPVYVENWSTQQEEWTFNRWTGTWRTLMTATSTDLANLLTGYGDPVYINLYIFDTDRYGLSALDNIEDSAVPDIANINKYSAKSDDVFANLNYMEISGINNQAYELVQHSDPWYQYNSKEGVDIIDASTSNVTEDYLYDKRNILFGLEYVRNIKVISNFETKEDDGTTPMPKDQLVKTIEDGYNRTNARQYKRTHEKMAINYKSSKSSSEDVTTEVLSEEYHYNYVIQNISLVNSSYATLYNSVYPHIENPASTIMFLPGSYLKKYTKVNEDTSSSEDSSNNSNSSSNSTDPEPYVESLLYNYSNDGGNVYYEKEFVSSDEYFTEGHNEYTTTNDDGTTSSEKIYWWEDKEGANNGGLYDFILIKEPYENTYYVFAYKHTNIFVKILSDDISSYDSDGFIEHDSDDAKSKLIFQNTYNIGASMSENDPNDYSINYKEGSIKSLLADYFSTNSLNPEEYILKDHVTKATMATFSGDTSNLSITFQPNFKIKKNYIFYLAKKSSS